MFESAAGASLPRSATVMEPVPGIFPVELARACSPAPFERLRVSRTLTRGAFWVKRYVVQDLVSKAAVLVCAWQLERVAPGPAVVATTCAAVEVLTFYVAAWARRRLARGGRALTLRASCVELLREYGPAELVDLAVRPLAMRVGLACSASDAAGLMLGSLVADLAFYAAAIASCRVGGLVAPRGGA